MNKKCTCGNTRPNTTCGCRTKLDARWIYYNGEKLLPLDVRPGDSVEQVIRSINDYLTDLATGEKSIEGIRNIGRGKKVFSNITPEKIIELRTLLGTGGIIIEETENTINIQVDEKWIEGKLKEVDINSVGTGIPILTDQDGKKVASITSEDSSIRVEKLEDGTINIETDTDTAITTAIQSDLSQGGIEEGQIIPEGTTLQRFVEMLLTKVFYPTFNNPTLTLSNNAGAREIGEVFNLVLTNTFNPGSINLKGVVQGPRAGAVTKHEIDGQEIPTTSNTQTKTIPGYKVVASQTFSSNISYAQGPQPKDSKNNDYLKPLPQAVNVLPTTTTVNGYLRRYAGSMVTVPNSGSEVRQALLSTSVLNTANKFTIPTGTTNRVFVIAVPENKTLSTVQNTGTNEFLYREGDVGSNFKPTANINTIPDAAGQDHRYKVYIMETAVPFSSNYTLDITLK